MDGNSIGDSRPHLLAPSKTSRVYFMSPSRDAVANCHCEAALWPASKKVNEACPAMT